MIARLTSEMPTPSARSENIRSRISKPEGITGPSIVRTRRSANTAISASDETPSMKLFCHGFSARLGFSLISSRRWLLGRGRGTTLEGAEDIFHVVWLAKSSAGLR